MIPFRLFSLASAWIAALAGAADAKDLLSARERDWILGIHGAVWTDSQLPNIPYRIITGNLTFQDAQLLEVALSRVVVKDFAIPLPGGYALTGNSVELQAIAAQHFGLENHQEGVLAVAVRSGNIPLWRGANVNVAWANGFSYAFEQPKLEKGPDGQPGEDSRHLQYYMGFESEWTLEEGARWHVTTDLHHRSGIYGVISPRHTGSNYIGGGLNFDF